MRDQERKRNKHIANENEAKIKRKNKKHIILKTKMAKMGKQSWKMRSQFEQIKTIIMAAMFHHEGWY